MRVYASGTLEARELLGELEYLWDQIKDVEFSDEEKYHTAHNVLTLVISNIDQLDRYSTATPWPLQSNYSASQHRSNLEQIYLHSRRNTQLSLNEHPQRKGTSLYLVPARQKEAQAVPASTLEDFRTWQGEINLIINKLSKEFMGRKNPPYSDSESEGEVDPSERLKRSAIHVLKLLGSYAWRFVKNVSITLLAILFVVWCVKKNVKVKRTVVRQQDLMKKELVINMVIPDENKWFVRLLSVINSFVGFV